MARRKYIPPIVLTESLEVDMNYALGCGSAIHSSTLTCLSSGSPNEYEDLVETWEIDPDTSFDSDIFTGIVFSSSKTCRASCYHGPYDSFFNS